MNKKPRFYTGFLFLIGGNAWESNPPLSLTRDIRFEVCGAHRKIRELDNQCLPDANVETQSWQIYSPELIKMVLLSIMGICL